jgi:CBS domain-containing protein
VRAINETGILVKDIMTKRIITADINTNLLEAVKKMARARVSTIVILENKKPVGIITDSDIIKKVVAQNLKPSTLKVEDIMSSPLITISPDADILEAEKIIREKKIRRIPVVKNDKLVGIITPTDVARNCPEMISLLKSRMEMEETTPTITQEPVSGLCEVCGNFSEDLKFENEQWVCEICRER